MPCRLLRGQLYWPPRPGQLGARVPALRNLLQIAPRPTLHSSILSFLGPLGPSQGSPRAGYSPPVPAELAFQSRVSGWVLARGAWFCLCLCPSASPFPPPAPLEVRELGLIPPSTRAWEFGQTARGYQIYLRRRVCGAGVLWGSPLNSFLSSSVIS